MIDVKKKNMAAVNNYLNLTESSSDCVNWNINKLLMFIK